MSKYFRYYFLLVISLFFIFNTGNTKGTEEEIRTCLQGRMMHQSAFNTNQSEPKEQAINAIHANEKNSFCRLGGERNLTISKEQQHVVYDFENTTFAIINNKIYAAISFQSYSTHIYSFLRSLLYPKHSFW